MTDAINSQENGLEIHHVGSYTFSQTGNSTKENNMGMREMQARAYAKRDSKYLLIQAPPASGKSRALMFLALDKVIKQGIGKAIIAVPQIAIGSSFAEVRLKRFSGPWNSLTILMLTIYFVLMQRLPFSLKRFRINPYSITVFSPLMNFIMCRKIPKTV